MTQSSMVDELRSTKISRVAIEAVVAAAEVAEREEAAVRDQDRVRAPTLVRALEEDIQALGRVLVIANAPTLDLALGHQLNAKKCRVRGADLDPL